MALVPTTFPLLPGAAVASFTWTDIAEGTGVQKFEGYVSEDISGEDFHLTTQVIYSKVIEDLCQTGALSGTYASKYSEDFDLTSFNLPRQIKGTALIQHGWAAVASGGSAGSPYIKMKYTIKNGATTIVSGESDEISISTDVVLNWTVIPMTVPLTSFKKGETLRLTVEVYAKFVGEGAETAEVYIGMDPKNRDGTNLKPSTDDIITNLQVYIPFVINL